MRLHSHSLLTTRLQMILIVTLVLIATELSASRLQNSFIVSWLLRNNSYLPYSHQESGFIHLFFFFCTFIQCRSFSHFFSISIIFHYFLVIFIYLHNYWILPFLGPFILSLPSSISDIKYVIQNMKQFTNPNRIWKLSSIESCILEAFHELGWITWTVSD
jgi:hypothetical protein